MKTLFSFIQIAFKARFAYRSKVLFGTLMSFVYMLVQIALWRFVFLKEPAKIRYMTAYVVLSQLLYYTYSTEITHTIGRKVRSGDFALDLIKPVNSILTYWGASLGGTLADIATRSLPILIIFSPVLLRIDFSVTKGLFFLVACAASYILISLIFILIGYLAFVVTEVWPIHRSMANTIRFLSGALIPLAFFPPWLASITKLLPFPLLYSFPIRVLLEDLPLEEMVKNTLLLGAWVALFFLLLMMAYKRAIWRSVVQGG